MAEVLHGLQIYMISKCKYLPIQTNFKQKIHYLQGVEFRVKLKWSIGVSPGHPWIHDCPRLFKLFMFTHFSCTIFLKIYYSADSQTIFQNKFLERKWVHSFSFPTFWHYLKKIRFKSSLIMKKSTMLVFLNKRKKNFAFHICLKIELHLKKASSSIVVGLKHISRAA